MRTSSLGLAVLDACLVTPEAAPHLAEAVEAFARLHDSTAVMVRSDGGIEITTYQRGGHTLPVEQAVERAHELLSHGRAVLLLEPTNREIIQNLYIMIKNRYETLCRHMCCD